MAPEIKKTPKMREKPAAGLVDAMKTRQRHDIPHEMLKRGSFQVFRACEIHS